MVGEGQKGGHSKLGKIKTMLLRRSFGKLKKLKAFSGRSSGNSIQFLTWSVCIGKCKVSCINSIDFVLQDLRKLLQMDVGVEFFGSATKKKKTRTIFSHKPNSHMDLIWVAIVSDLHKLKV